MNRFCRLTAVGALITSACASPGAGERSVGLTIYNDDLALVRDTRTFTLEAGSNVIEVSDVAARIIPTSVLLSGDGLSVVEQNFAYDLAGGDRILERYLDRDVTVVLEGGEAFTGRLVSYDGGSYVLVSGERTRVVSRQRVDHVDFPELPGGLRTRPTLVWQLASERRGSREATFSYLTEGIAWHAEYVALVDEQDTALELSAWVSLDNRSGVAYEDAALQLVAGDVHRARRDHRMRVKGGALMAEAMDAPAEEGLLEYHLYTFERPITIADRETKQLTLFPTAAVSTVEKRFHYRGGDRAEVRLAFRNEKERGLGLPLPRGIVRVYKKDSRGGAQFVGEDAIDHTPRDEEVEITLGRAFDVAVERIVQNERRISRNVIERDVEVEIRNRKDEAIELIVEESVYGEWEVVTSSHDPKRRSATELWFRVPAPARASTKLTFTIRTSR